MHKLKPIGGRSPARKGRRVEQELVRLLVELGLLCQRVPLSGAAGGAWTNDLHIELRGRTRQAEVKSRKQLRVYDWLGKADMLILKADRLPPLVVLPLELFVELATAPEPQELFVRVHFDPVPERLSCACGGARFALRHLTDGAIVTCDDCHDELGTISVDVETRS